MNSRLMEEFVKAGGVVEVSYYECQDKFHYDVKTGMKSECIILENGNMNETNELTASMRYGMKMTISDDMPLKEFVELVVSSCMHGSSYISVTWLELCRKLGVTLPG